MNELKDNKNAPMFMLIAVVAIVACIASSIYFFGGGSRPTPLPTGQIGQRANGLPGPGVSSIGQPFQKRDGMPGPSN
jgi:hypothetical protein